MDANYIYDIFETIRKTDAPDDLHIGLAMLRTEKPIPDGMTEGGIHAFFARHYEKLTDAYRARDREKFAAVVAACEAEDKAREEARAEQEEEDQGEEPQE